MDWRTGPARILLGISLALQLLTPVLATGQGPGRQAVSGTVVNAANRPIPGLTVSLVHPSVGRSHPTFTDSSGRFTFSNVPVRQEPYYLEIYWGQQLLYRGRLSMRPAGVQVPPIVLR